MLQYIKKIWLFISFLGLAKENEIDTDELKIRVFFNRCIFVGFFTLFGTIASSLPFIGNYAYLNLISSFAILIALILQKKGRFNVAKRIVAYSVFLIGLFLSAISGPDFFVSHRRYYDFGFFMGIIQT